MGDAAVLERCPFCGGEGRVVQSSGVWWAECGLCRAATAGERTEPTAAENWNRRTGPQADRPPPKDFALSQASRRRAESVRRMYPVLMPAGKAMRLLGITRNTFYKLAKDGRYGTVDTGGKHARYSTDAVLRAAGLE